MMGRDWQQTKEKAYLMPHEIYHMTIWFIRDLHRMEKCVAELNKIQNPTSMERENKKLMETRVSAIKDAYNIIPPEFVKYINANIFDRKSGASFPVRDKEWRKWKQRFVYQVAVNANFYKN